MQQESLEERLTLITAEPGDEREGFAQEVRLGLGLSPKRLPCHLLYDERGSRLFEQICELPEYYLTRVERSILEARAVEIARHFPEGATLVELGSGTSKKTRVLIEAFLEVHGAPLHYEPIDVSGETLETTARELLATYPGLEITAFAGQYADGLDRLADEYPEARLVLWLGSSVGNLDRHAAAAFLHELARGFRPVDRLLVGIDLRKDSAVLESAYDDTQGVTEKFSLNVLERINRELGADFVPRRFRHMAEWNEEEGRIEIRVVSCERQDVAIDDLDLVVPFRAGEAIDTESSYKYSPAEIEELAGEAGLRLERQWFDEERRFSLSLLALPT